MYVDPTAGGMLVYVLGFVLTIFSALVLFFSRQLKSTFSRIKRHLREQRKL